MNSYTLLVTADPNAKFLNLLDPFRADTRIFVSKDRAELREHAPHADIILGADFDDPQLLQDTFPYATRARWVHSLFAGVEHILSPAIVRSSVPLTNGRGASCTALGEWVLAAMLHFAYDLRRLQRHQLAERWEHSDVEGLQGRTLGLIGHGAIARAVAERARPFGMRILALRRRPDSSTQDPLIDATYSTSMIGEMLGQCDYVAVAVPLTLETRQMIAAEQIAAMKPSAVIINVGRGRVLDEAALVRALDSGKIRGAALDVFETEPLPPGHPLYHLGNVLLSPHSADHTPGWLERGMECFLDNFARFRSGEPLQNLVDKQAGY